MLGVARDHLAAIRATVLILFLRLTVLTLVEFVDLIFFLDTVRNFLAAFLLGSFCFVTIPASRSAHVLTCLLQSFHHLLMQIIDINMLTLHIETNIFGCLSGLLTFLADDLVTTVALQSSNDH